MSVYVGIDVHRKRSQVAVVTGDGTVELNKNVVNGSEPMLRLIGDLPAGTPVAFEAAFGWGWLVELLEDYGFDPHLVHPLRCKAIASARCCGTGPAWSGSAPSCRTVSTRWRPTSATTGPGATGPGPARLAGRAGPAAISREIVTDCLAVIDGLEPAIGRIDG